jgi:hypothetical protein
LDRVPASSPPPVGDGCAGALRGVALDGADVVLGVALDGADVVLDGAGVVLDCVGEDCPLCGLGVVVVVAPCEVSVGALLRAPGGNRWRPALSGWEARPMRWLTS